MARLNQPFDVRSVDPNAGSRPQFPVGRHPVVILSDETLPTKDEESGKVEFTLRITQGPNAGFEGFYSLNLYNKSPKAAEVAFKQLSAIGYVVGVYVIEDTSQLYNKEFIVEVEPQKDPDNKSQAHPKGYTEIKRVFDMQGNLPNHAGQGQGSAQPTQNTPQAGQQGGSWGGNAPQGNQQQAPAASQWGGQPPQGQQNQPAPGGWGNPANNGTAPVGGQQGGNGGGAWGAPQGAGNAPAGNPSWGARK